MEYIIQKMKDLEEMKSTITRIEKGLYKLPEIERNYNNCVLTVMKGNYMSKKMELLDLIKTF